MAQLSLLMLTLLFRKLPLNIDLFAFDEEIDGLLERPLGNPPGFTDVPEVFVNTTIKMFDLNVFRVFSLIGSDNKFLNVLVDPFVTLSDVVQLFTIGFLLVMITKAFHHCLLHFLP